MVWSELVPEFTHLLAREVHEQLPELLQQTVLRADACINKVRGRSTCVNSLHGHLERRLFSSVHPWLHST